MKRPRLTHGRGLFACEFLSAGPSTECGVEVGTVFEQDRHPVATVAEDLPDADPVPTCFEDVGSV